ncbi:putative HCP-like protein [Lyophyllum shimeji]|uniref:HCP-like protein n=1 Tax=Lyophyllum shimeji TaxID=47721 RepID=A0A9P3PG42_LYOSH|nr:putative HCP-like protein [Lyophyllum shimeji]
MALRSDARRHALYAEVQGSSAPSLPSVPDSNPEATPPPSITLMQHDDHSAPSLPSEHPPQYAEYPDSSGPNAPFDPTAALDNFSALRIHETGFGSDRADPVPRVGSSMSTRSLQNVQHHPRPTHAATLPPPNHGPYYPVDSPVGDGASLHSGGSRNSHHGSIHEAERLSAYSYEDPHGGYHSPDSVGLSPQNRVYQQQPWQPNPNEYNPLYAAASNVLGMAPPPGPASSPSIRQAPPMPGYPPTHSSLAHSQSSLSSSNSGPFPGASGHHNHYAPSIASYPAVSSSSHPSESEPRPSFHRAETSASVTPSTHKSKAVDLSAPPFTKEYIEQYRQRIKADPDPEAHFLYAKYLIDAARHIRSTAKDQRAARKYSEVLIGESLKVIRRLATQGEAYDEAQFFLANCYGTGALGLQVDHERAYHLYLQAAKQNHAAASYRVAVCNEIGAGTRREPPRAAAFYRKAASLGDTPAMYKLGMILLNGLLGEQKNPREAINWLKRAAEQADEDNPHALHELALLHEVPNSTLVPYDPAYARSLFTQAAQLGYTPSQFKLGQCFEYGSLTCPVDPRRSIAWYTKAAEKGDPEAELALSGWYLTGSEGVLKQSDSEAYLWARRAANKGLSKAEYAVGYYAEVGIGIKQDIEFAKRWYMRAAAQGNKRAMNRLTEMKRMGNKRANVARPTRQQAKDECVIC